MPLAPRNRNPWETPRHFLDHQQLQQHRLTSSILLSADARQPVGEPDVRAHGGGKRSETDFCRPVSYSRCLLTRSFGGANCCHRPGMGGSTPVPLNMRVKVWLEMVAAVLQRLNVQHIDLLLSHSAGTIYSLNTLYTHRNFLNPAGASVVFLGENLSMRTIQSNANDFQPRGYIMSILKSSSRTWSRSCQTG